MKSNTFTLSMLTVLALQGTAIYADEVEASNTVKEESSTTQGP